MLDNFHLTVLIKTRRQTQLQKIPLHKVLQQKLGELWYGQLTSFTENTQELDFDPGYKLESHERFKLENFVPPEYLADENASTIHNLDPIDGSQRFIGFIKAVVGFARDEERGEVILFQNFTKSHVIRPGRFIFLQGNIYMTTENPGLTLDTKLAAIYWIENKKLLFRNFRSTNSFLPLADFYKEATEQEIREILTHEKIASENAEETAKNISPWFSKRFAMLRDSHVLDNYTVQQIFDHSREYGISIRIDNSNGIDKLIFPAEKTAAKKLLQFLNEELFRGAITDKLFETNSKREA